MNAIKRIFAALGVIFALALFAGVCGISAVWAVRYFSALMPPGQTAVQTPAVQPPAIVPEQPATVTFEPPVQQQPPAQVQPSEPQAEGALAPGVYGWNLELVLERSHTGRELRRYAKDYVDVMNKSIAELDKALAGNDKRLNRDEAKKLRADFVKRRDGMDTHTSEFLARIVGEAFANEPELAGITLIEQKNFTRLAKDADLTVKVIETIDRFHMKLPPLPKALKLEPPPQQQQATRKKR